MWVAWGPRQVLGDTLGVTLGDVEIDASGGALGDALGDTLGAALGEALVDAPGDTIDVALMRFDSTLCRERSWPGGSLALAGRCAMQWGRACEGFKPANAPCG